MRAIIAAMILFLSLFSSISHAKLFTIDTTGISDENILNAFAILEDRINGSFSAPDINIDEYLEGFANTCPMATKGSGADYASDLSLFGVSVNMIGAAVEMENGSFMDLVGGDFEGEFRGAGINMFIFTVGMNLRLLPFEKLGPLNLNRAKLYLQAGKSNKLTGDDMDFSAQLFSVMFQYKLIDPASVAAGLFKWGGIDFTTGISSQTQNAMLNLKTPSDPITSGGAVVNMTSEIEAGIKVETTSIPFELSTYGRLFYILRPFVGVGGDLNFGSAKGIAGGSYTVNVTEPVVSSVTASVDLLGQEKNVDTFNMRWFAGVQLNIFILKIYAIVQESMSRDIMAAQVGFGAVW
ncbi:MAG: hypothetical protein A2504_17470 [Bdellovibrionales bacterium RIFOXYD12_FULL_39_22]|nr:MAG: hypothetical protein A2385_10490 [Bdellovibrionales bacterium RIFOXYB1_FULL_39_21]OFZ40792.1 MAG: hypothetical protein A2485_17240 [Bdellovibrionales bacterium RIFOXYC12_FULL_39_17]OFZ48214.1 MAG: hypothetical protein A2404_17400 [Bdellovibrionales bacterium RIFOXYC1_FULL_39_130]OFZ75864.1 MAG: hypothetical protein A2560_13900 [Bdellovibrionales bacterium RIFOXYD1_FULL_39_84]OFZ91925.1 MAG: hypothetical protein A2504_17470 [Bdellovibrionales bacterium RIFOXYD12_FULL_39_22]HLE11438.1 hy